MGNNKKSPLPTYVRKRPSQKPISKHKNLCPLEGTNIRGYRSIHEV